MYMVVNVGIALMCMSPATGEAPQLHIDDLVAIARANISALKAVRFVFTVTQKLDETAGTNHPDVGRPIEVVPKNWARR
jgi:hypothetical protein